MNGAADMGGMHGFGPIEREANEPVFHAEWERRIFALTMAMAASGRWSMDEFRYAREKLPPTQYLSASYYGLWVITLENLIRDHRIASNEELAAGRTSAKPSNAIRTIGSNEIAAMVRRGAHYDRPPANPAQFKAGDAVRARNIHPETHTRLPRYVRAHAGKVVRVIGCHVFPDVHATAGREEPHWLYSVRFDGRELWGNAADATLKVHIDAWEPYLQPA